MAVPHVSGTIALMLGHRRARARTRRRRRSRDRLQTTARDLGKPGYDSTYGWGLLDAAAATTPLP